MSSTLGASCSSHWSAACAGDTEASGRPYHRRAREDRVILTARPAERTERHECNATAEALLQDRGPAAVGQVEQVLYAGNAGTGRGVLQLSEADVTQAYPGDQALVAGRDHRGHLVIETGIYLSVAGQPQVNRC
jgi:hypothetical protein